VKSRPDGPNRPNLRVEVLLFAAGWGANHFSTMLVVYRRDLGLSASALGILFGAYAVGLVPGLVLAGRLSDRLGRRALVLPAACLAIAASLVLAFGAHGFGVLLAGRLLYGLAMGSVMSPGSVWVQDLTSTEHGARRATLALSAGFGLGPLVSGLIAELAPAPMVLPYVVHAGVAVVALAGARRVPDGGGRAAPVSVASTGATSLAGGGSATTVGGLAVGEWAILAELLPVAPWAFGFAAVTMAILPGILRVHVARPVLYSALVIVTTLASGVAVQPLPRRLGVRAGLLGLGLGALGILLGARAVAAAAPGWAFAVALFEGAGYGLVMTTGLVDIGARVSPSARGTAVGIYYVLTNVGFALPFVHAQASLQAQASLHERLGDAGALDRIAVAAFASLGLRGLVLARRR
jgi:MFS family permease